MRTVILVPRRDDGGHRDELWKFCKQKWIENFDDLPIYDGYHEYGPFNRSFAINRASDLADADGRWDVALIIDSDTTSDPTCVRKALEAANATGGLVVAHDERHMLNSRATTRILKGDVGSWKRSGMISKTYRDSVSCAVAVSRRTWDVIGGFDERFEGWGFEDTAFHIACETITGLPIQIIPGDCFHLYHATGPETSQQSITYKRNHTLKRRYEAVRWSPDHLLRMLKRVADEVPVGHIPRILHRTVPAETSEQVEWWWEQFGQLHPDWDMRTYREPIDPKDWPLTGTLFSRCQNGAQKAGLIRLEALYTYGGVYVDSDVEPYRSFESLLPLPAFAAWEDSTTVPDAVMGACAGHPAWEQLIGRARESIMNNQDAWSSGPGGTTEVLPGRSDVVLFPPGAFYPAHYLEKNNLGKSGAQPWVFCEHKWHHSWGTEAQKQSIERAQRVRSEPRARATPTRANVVMSTAPVSMPTDFKIGICIPWDDTADNWRSASFKWCKTWWKNGGFDVYLGEGPSRSAMRNDAARRAIAEGVDVLFFADADTWVTYRQVIEACRIAHENDQLVHAFDSYVRLGSSITKQQQQLRNPDIAKLARMGTRQRDHMSGASAISVEFWNDIGGYDERFVAWGYEDRAFDLAAGCIGSGIGRVPGFAVHWYHKPAAEKATRPVANEFTVELIVRYCVAAAKVPPTGRTARLAMDKVPKDAKPDPDAMRVILSEDGAPLGAAVLDSAR